MKIAIIHYHLKRGGVTRVIESTLRGFGALPNPPQFVVLAGEIPDAFAEKNQARQVPGLGYSNSQAKTPDSRSLLENMRASAREALGGDPELWHIHNHSLGKNGAMPGVVAELAKSGEAVLLQMHDFAEDGRPENHRLNQARAESALHLYPDADNIHYGVINARDHAILHQSGMDEARLHLLPNPVEADRLRVTTDHSPILNTLGAQRLFLYPVRAVRRKNFGEMLLWAALAEDGDVFATTLGPTNQNYREAYEDWRAFAEKHELPVRFGIAEQYDWPFEAIMQSAHAILSTSIAEGFGLAFLEPWLFGKAITGRDLPAITADFKAHGIQLDGLYQSLPIPSDWIDMNHLKAAIEEGLSEAYAAYERPLPENAADRALAAIRPSPDHIDFAGLDEALQQSVIEHVLSDPGAASELPRLGNLADRSRIQENARKIAKHYSLPRYTENLNALYHSIRSSGISPDTHFIDPAKVLDGFLQPERFRLLRT